MPSLPTSNFWHPSLFNAVSIVVWTAILLSGMDCIFGQANAETSDDKSAPGKSHEAVKQFENEIRPALIEHCIKCHGDAKQEGGLRLDSRDALLTGGDSGPAILPGDVEQSLILSALNHQDFEMPPGKKLDDRIIQEFTTWVANGALWPATDVALRREAMKVTDEDKNWWAYKTIQPIGVPVVEGDVWSRNEIDRFVWKDLKSKGIEPAPSANAHVLLRRLYLQLIGVPPTLEELREFTNDPSDEAYERTVDRLLQDPRFGEHMARFWLDLVRYSESDGWNQDAYRPNIFRYRDFVINAWNEDMPFAEFVLAQLAGDEIAGDDPQGKVAAGFLRLGIYEYNQRDAKSHWNDIMNELTDVVGDTFLGLSLSCTRCHDHKFDAIPQADYYKLRAFVEPIVWRDDLTASTLEEQKSYSEKLAQWETQTKPIREKLDQLLKPYETKKWESTVEKFPLDIQACFHKPKSERTSWDEQMAYLVSRQYWEEGGGPYNGMKKEDQELRKQYQEELAKFDEIKPAPLPPIMSVSDCDGVISETSYLTATGEQKVTPGYLEVLPSLRLETIPETNANSTGRRTQLARWISHPDNPLTNRVMANRIWQQLFGVGLVQTSSDFGTQGTPPSNPELLDWLTTFFIANNGRIKPLCKQIVMSATWRQSATHPDAESNLAKDPEENSYWRFAVRRLTAEQIRDSILSASGELKSELGGPSVEETEPRRSIYVKSQRNSTSNFLHSFDMANGLQSISVRDSTTTPMQSLTLLNNRFVLDRAKRMAISVREQSNSVDEAIDRMFLLTWGRPPDPSERDNVYGFLKVSLEEPDELPDVTKLEDLCHVLFNSNPFLYKE
ncbi:MAG: PSD1 and planctomycete cytochrome C domain-containing protein [Pirellula sp.]|jgi:mono/diheme cytochrome c family protein|nr:PSD1 and planctomycete cytochrome C domain-containing protein [Pirellula sp.]